MIPLHTAAREGNAENVRSLLREGADVHALDDLGRTALYYAALTARAEVVTVLLAWGCDPDSADEGGVTPLMAAIGMEIFVGVDFAYGIGEYICPASEEEIATIKALLTGRPDLDQPDRGGRTAMHYAANKLNATAFELLAEAGADLTLWEDEGEDAKRMAFGAYDRDDPLGERYYAQIAAAVDRARA